MHESTRRWVLAAGLLLVTAAAPAFAAEKSKGEYDIIAYGKECAELIAEAPPYNCLDGDIVPITVDGKTPTEYTRHMTCDRPAYLPYPEKTDGQCTPYSRVRTVRDDDIQMLLFCRRMYIRPIDDPRFDSMEIIMHNVVTGSTCFFISKNFGDKPEGDDGRRVPPPTEETPPEGNIAARDLWGTPDEIAEHKCIMCHDSDPWMRTPWIAQTEQLPADPFGYHSVDAGGPFQSWPKPMSIKTRGNSCTGCHRIGSLNTCGSQVVGTFGQQPAKMLQSIGRAPHGILGNPPGASVTEGPKTTSAWANTFPHDFWMPVGNELTLEEWNVIYEQDVADLERCCADHDAPGCIVEPIVNKEAWLRQEMSAHGTKVAKR
ncbi:MAG: hypothetical protein FJ144_10530 [Deltaproteobacteria bacterium]|nr:hypothetical protein [Deltaproteobacteria bacterium]